MGKNNFDESFAESKARKEKGQRGKSAEDIVRDLLNRRKAEDTNFDFIRLPDARAAGRPMPAQPCDFLCWCVSVVKTSWHKYSFALEVKNIKKGDRLPKKSIGQLAKLHRLSSAGPEGLVLVYLEEFKEWWMARADTLRLDEVSWKITQDNRWVKTDLEDLFK